MFKVKTELILVFILIPILGYVAWQAYNTYFKQTEMSVMENEPISIEQEKISSKEFVPAIVEEKQKIEITQNIPATTSNEESQIEEEFQQEESKGTLDYTGFSERDPLKPSLPVPEKPKITEMDLTIGQQPASTPESPETKEETQPKKQIIFPTFTITGIVWGKASPRAIIDNQVYKIGDTVKGAKIIDITKKGIQMTYEGEKFYVSRQK